MSVKTCNCLGNALSLSSHSEERKFEIMGHLQQMVHDTHGFYSKIINEIWHLSVLLLRLPLKTHIWSQCLMKRVEQCYFKALKTSFVENKGQSGPLSADSKTQGKCQLSVKFSAICQLSVKILAICQLSVNPIQALFWMCYSAPEHLLCLAAQRESSRPSKWTIEQRTVFKGF